MKYSQEITDEICKYLQVGNTQRDSALLAGISEDTYYAWQKEHSEFSEAVKKAEYQCKARNIAIIQKAAEKTWQAAAWYLERRYNNEYALKQVNELTGLNGEPIKLNIISGSDYVSAIGNLASTSTSGAIYGPTEVQGSSVAPQSEEDDNSDKSDSKVDAA